MFFCNSPFSKKWESRDRAPSAHTYATAQCHNGVRSAPMWKQHTNFASSWRDLLKQRTIVNCGFRPIRKRCQCSFVCFASWGYEVDRGLADDGHHSQWALWQGQRAPCHPMNAHMNTCAQFQCCIATNTSSFAKFYWKCMAVSIKVIFPLPIVLTNSVESKQHIVEQSQ